jgi:hypothetical protein
MKIVYMAKAAACYCLLCIVTRRCKVVSVYKALYKVRLKHIVAEFATLRLAG